jgi:hypothetical protein
MAGPASGGGDPDAEEVGEDDLADSDPPAWPYRDTSVVGSSSVDI